VTDPEVLRILLSIAIKRGHTEALYASDRNRWLHKNNISSLLLFQLHPRGSSKRYVL